MWQQGNLSKQWMRRAGAGAFFFFFAKGLVWLGLAGAAGLASVW